MVGTSNGCCNLGRNIKNCLSVRIMIIWWSSRNYDDSKCSDHHGSSEWAMFLSHGCSLKAKGSSILCFSKWLLPKSLSKSKPSRMPMWSFVNFSLLEKIRNCCLWPHLYVDRPAFGRDSLIETTLELKISMALCTHKSSMETNKKRERENV